MCGYCPRLPRLLSREPGSRPRGGSGLLARVVQQPAQAGRTPAVATPGCAESTPGTPLSWQRLDQNQSTGWGLVPLGGQWDFPGLSSQSCEAGHQQRDILGVPPSQGGSGQPPLLSGQTTLHRNLEDFRRGTLQRPRDPQMPGSGPEPRGRVPTTRSLLLSSPGRRPRGRRAESLSRQSDKAEKD